VKEGKLGDVSLVSIVKETAPTADAKTDAELGVGDFSNKYFLQYPTYVDPDKKFFAILGNKPFSLLSLLGSLFNPFSFGFTEFAKRWKARGIQNNYKGDYALKGGLLIYSQEGKLAYMKSEEETMDLPYDEIIAAATKLNGGEGGAAQESG
jgi:hypothetical protein